jgi:dihydroorotate dehydrogenase electron transfer subunit
MRETQAIIERVRRITTTLQHIDLSVDPALTQLQPGQSVLAIPQENPAWTPYLREQWLPVDAQGARLTVELPAAIHYAPGQVISLLAPVGKPVPLRPGARNLLLIAEDATPTPLVWIARECVRNGAAVTLVLGGQALDYPLEQFPAEVEILRGDTDWSWPEQVETLTWADQVIALAPPFLQAESYGRLHHAISQLRHRAPEHFACGLFYQRLACGTGACGACMTACQDGDRLVCVDGPAFDLKDVRFS